MSNQSERPIYKIELNVTPLIVAGDWLLTHLPLIDEYYDKLKQRKYCSRHGHESGVCINYSSTRGYAGEVDWGIGRVRIFTVEKEVREHTCSRCDQSVVIEDRSMGTFPHASYEPAIWSDGTFKFPEVLYDMRGAGKAFPFITDSVQDCTKYVCQKHGFLYDIENGMFTDKCRACRSTEEGGDV